MTEKASHGAGTLARHARPGAARPVDPFSAGLLVAGLLVGMPVSVALGVAAGQVVRALLVPALTVAVTGWLWLRVRGRDGVRADLRTPIVRRRDLPRFTAGAVVAVLAIAALHGGVW